MSVIFLFIVLVLSAVQARDFTIFQAKDEETVATEKEPIITARVGRGLKGVPPAEAANHFKAKKAMKAMRSKLRPKQKPVAAVDAKAEDIPKDDKPGFDFVVAGFPKCGTTTLLKAFEAHEETDMAASEQCAIASPLQADARVHKLLDGTLNALSSRPQMKRSFKCPTAMYNYKSIARMEKHSPNAKFVIGMRHPVKMLQSFYNYRITEIKERGLDEAIPSLEKVLANDMPWKGVSMQSTRFELFLMQLGKTDVSAEHLTDLTRTNYDLAIKPTTFSVFLYTVDQLEDANEQRNHELRRHMQEYLDLKKPIEPFGHENTNHHVGKAAHAESISICDNKWATVRAQLIEQGAKTAEWIRDHFIHSEDVQVANQEHFLETLQSWGSDPCAAITSA